MIDYFNDPERMNTLFVKKNGCVVLCDIDGTITQHENVSDYNKDLVVLDGSIEKLNEWYKNHAYIILVTSRFEKDREKLVKALAKSNIKYDKLVMGLPPGPRYLINDKKPYTDTKMANSIEIKRDEGIKTIGHSFAKINVRENTLTKSLPPDAPEVAVNKFKWQYQTMEELSKIDGVKNAIPKVSNFSSHKFDIEYYENHKGLNEFNAQQRQHILKHILNEYMQKMYKHDFCCLFHYNENSPKYVYWIKWFDDFMNRKVFAKKEILKKYNLDTSVLNKIQKYYKEYYYKIQPQFFTKYFHGDFTYENILFDNFDTKLIDFDNDHDWGPIELDLGKLTQSIITKYESWSLPEIEIKDTDEEFEIVLRFYSSLITERYIRSKAYFYCIIHLVRMIPFQAKRDIKRCDIAMKWIKELLERLHQIED